MMTKTNKIHQHSLGFPCQHFRISLSICFKTIKQLKIYNPTYEKVYIIVIQKICSPSCVACPFSKVDDTILDKKRRYIMIHESKQ